MKFEWDKEKAESNLKKHGISFDEAVSAFDDLFNVDLFDPKHSEDENRFILVGQSENERILIVSYAERGDKIRIINARKVTSKERKDYENGRFE
ncbi:MAG: BrnT family toxin [Acidobacteriota bacterium]|jgi:uncharacterized DUF497 family protein|nr:BrnT family toxin [Acidobacteriota bacterium]